MRLKHYLALVIQVCVLLSASVNSNANSWGREFFRAIDTVIVESSIHRKDASVLGLSKNFPLSHSSLNGLAAKSLNQHFEGSSLKVVTAHEVQKSYSLRNKEKSSNELYVLLDYIYWNKEDFDPKLNHDLIVLNIKYKRRAPFFNESSLGDPFQEMHMGTMLLSVPDEEALPQKIEKYLSIIFKTNITPYLLCANGGSCSGL